MKIEEIARACHEVNRAYCQALGDESQERWVCCEEWQRRSAINGVEHAIRYPNEGPAISHANWLKQKEEEGWTYGEVKDAEKKTHPCFRLYHELPREQRAKDAIFIAVVRGLEPPNEKG